MTKKTNHKNEPSSNGQPKTSELIIPAKLSVEEVRKALRFTILGDIVEPLDGENWGRLNLKD